MVAIRTMILMLVAMMSMVMVPAQAHAFEWLACDGNGGVRPGTSFFDTTKTPSAPPAEAEEGEEEAPPPAEDPDPEEMPAGRGTCDYNGLAHIFSQVICDFLKVLNDILGKLYCSIQHALVGTLRILMSIYVAVFGWQILMGTAQLNARDIMTRLIKMAVVFMFATQATWGVNIIFNSAVAFISEVSYWIVNSIPQLAELDVTEGHCGAIQFANKGEVMPLFLFFDCLIKYTFLGSAQFASIRVLGLFGGMIIAYPPLFLMAFVWAQKTFLTMVRTIINFLMALAAIAFLVALTPIFFSFMLFQFTNHFFENWLRYLISYCLQVVLVFAVIVMWVLVFIQFLSFFDDLSSIIFPYKPALEQSATLKPTQAWGICPALYGENDEGQPTARCMQIGGEDFNPYPMLKPIPPYFTETEELNPNWRDHAKRVIPPAAIIENSEFLYFVFYHLVGLLIVTYAFGTILEHVPKIAQSISSPAALPQILGGFGTTPWGEAGGKVSDNLRGGLGSISRNAGGAETGKR